MEENEKYVKLIIDELKKKKLFLEESPNFKEYINKIYKEVFYLKGQFIVFNELYNYLMKNNKENIELIGVIFDSLEFSILLKLANLYDMHPQCISLVKIFNLLQNNKELLSNKQLKSFINQTLNIINTEKDLVENIKNLKTIRDKGVSHFEKKENGDIKRISTSCGFDLMNIKQLADFSYDTIIELYYLLYNEKIDNAEYYKKCIEQLYNDLLENE